MEPQQTIILRCKWEDVSSIAGLKLLKASASGLICRATPAAGQALTAAGIDWAPHKELNLEEEWRLLMGRPFPRFPAPQDLVRLGMLFAPEIWLHERLPFRLPEEKRPYLVLCSLLRVAFHLDPWNAEDVASLTTLLQKSSHSLAPDEVFARLSAASRIAQILH